MREPTNPFHPGEILLEEFLKPMGMTQAAFAERVGWTRARLNELINGKRGFTSKMALLFEQVTEGRYPAEFWLLAQMRWDLAEAHSSLSPARKSMVDPADIATSAAAATSAPAYTGDLLKLAKKLRQTRE